jgi:hypothetical protein
VTFAAEVLEEENCAPEDKSESTDRNKKMLIIFIYFHHVT